MSQKLSVLKRRALLSWTFGFLILASYGCRHHTRVYHSDEQIGIGKERRASSTMKATGLVDEINSETTPIASNLRSDLQDPVTEDLAYEENAGVVVENGYVCVPEDSMAAQSLAEILDRGLDEDLAKSVEVDSASSIAPIKVVDHPDVDKWVKYFTDKDRERFQRFLTRGASYQKLVLDILAEEGVPKELYYLAMIESGYSTGARSWASAVGIWQFIPGTGKRYGLKINSYVDERKDPVRSTRAAARYLASLFRVYQNWELAMASYNAGERRILGAILRGHTRDFWELSKKKLLPRETRNYVPKMMAAMKIGQNLERYGFKSESDNPYLLPASVNVPSSVRIKDIARIAGVSHKELKRLNPHIRRGVTPPGKKDYTLWLPQGYQTASLEKSYNTLKAKRIRLATSTAGTHVVRRGQNLSSIARRYGTTVNNLKRLNGLRSSRIYAGQRLKVNATSSSSAKFYRIRRGDTLYGIAKKHGTTVNKLKRRNNLRGSRVYVGQRLKL